jgi:transposase
MARMGSRKAGRRVRRQFSEEFRGGAVRLVLDEGKTIGAVARELDLTPSSLANWVRQARADRSKGKTGLTTEERAELATLRKENRELRMERDILKKFPCPGETPAHAMKVVASARARRPGQGRRLLVPRARKKMDPSTAPGAPRIVARRTAGALEHAR